MVIISQSSYSYWYRLHVICPSDSMNEYSLSDKDMSSFLYDDDDSEDNLHQSQSAIGKVANHYENV